MVLFSLTQRFPGACWKHNWPVKQLRVLYSSKHNNSASICVALYIFCLASKEEKHPVKVKGREREKQGRLKQLSSGRSMGFSQHLVPTFEDLCLGFADSHYPHLYSQSEEKCIIDHELFRYYNDDEYINN